MTCDSARRLAEFARPGVTELDAADVSRLETHLADCRECAAAVRAERTADERISRAIKSVPPTTGAAERLRAVLRKRRLIWYRWRIAAVAGPVVVGGLAWLAWPSPRLDFDAIADQILAGAGHRAAADAWLQAIDARFGFPPKFRPKYLVRYERRAYHGTTAPVLEFVRKNTFARVAVVTEDQFRNLRGTPDGAAAWNSTAAVQLLRDESFPGIVFVIEVVNGPVEPFFTEDDPPVT